MKISVAENKVTEIRGVFRSCEQYSRCERTFDLIFAMRGAGEMPSAERTALRRAAPLLEKFQFFTRTHFEMIKGCFASQRLISWGSTNSTLENPIFEVYRPQSYRNVRVSDQKSTRA